MAKGKRKLPSGMRWKTDGCIESRFYVEGKRYSVAGASVAEVRELAGLFSAVFIYYSQIIYIFFLFSNHGTVKNGTVYFQLKIDENVNCGK